MLVFFGFVGWVVLVLLEFMLGGVGFVGLSVGWCWFCWNSCWVVLGLLEFMLGGVGFVGNCAGVLVL